MQKFIALDKDLGPIISVLAENLEDAEKQILRQLTKNRPRKSYIALWQATLTEKELTQAIGLQLSTHTVSIIKDGALQTVKGGPTRANAMKKARHYIRATLGTSITRAEVEDEETRVGGFIFKKHTNIYF